MKLGYAISHRAALRAALLFAKHGHVFKNLAPATNLGGGTMPPYLEAVN